MNQTKQMKTNTSNGMGSKISVVILTWNEELNLLKCLKSIEHLADEVFIVESYSTDKTIEIAKKHGAHVTQREFKNQAAQFNWALDNLNIKNEWILRLDADEVITPELEKKFWRQCRASRMISRFYIKKGFILRDVG